MQSRALLTGVSLLCLCELCQADDSIRDVRGATLSTVVDGAVREMAQYENSIPSPAAAKTITRVFANALLRGDDREKAAARRALIGYFEKEHRAGYHNPRMATNAELFVWFCYAWRHASADVLLEEMSAPGGRRLQPISVPCSPYDAIVFQLFVQPSLWHKCFDGARDETKYHVLSDLRFYWGVIGEDSDDARLMGRLFLSIQDVGVLEGAIGQPIREVGGDDRTIFWPAIPNDDDLECLWQTTDRLRALGENKDAQLLRNDLLAQYFSAVKARVTISDTARERALRVLAEDEPEVFPDVAEVVRRSATLTPEVLELLRRKCDDESQRIRAAAASVLATRGGPIREIHLAILEDAMKSRTWNSGWFEVLIDLLPEDKRARVLEEAIFDLDPLYHCDAMAAIVKMRDQGIKYAPMLERMMKREPISPGEPDVKAATALAQLPNIDLQEKGFRQLLAWATPALETSDFGSQRQWKSLEAISKLGDVAQPARSVLAKYLGAVIRHQDHERVLRELIRAVGRIRSEESRGALLSLLDETDGLDSWKILVHREVIRALRELEISDVRTSARLIELFDSNVPYLRLKAVRAFMGCRVNGPAVRAALLHVAQTDPYDRIRQEAENVAKTIQ